jgi:biotin carboxylase
MSGEAATAPPAAANGHRGDGQDTGRGALLVLGAGEDQLPVYVEAKRRGFRTIAVDSSTDRPALRYADEHLHISTRDHAAVAAALGRRRLAGVVSAASDASLETWHELSDRYRAPFRYPRTAAVASIDKVAFHAIATAAGVTAYRWRQHTDPRALVELAPEVGFPLVAKPADSSGSKGVTLVRRPEDLPAALDYAAEFALNGKLVVEEFLAGRNLTVDVFMRDGQAAFAGITEKRILPGVHFVIGGHTCPAPIDDQLHGRLVGLAARLCRAIGLRDGPANFDVIVAADSEVRVLEANARLCGNAFPLLMREVYGVDTVAALTSLALGEPFELVATRHRAGIIHVLASPLDVDGVLTGISGLAEARAIPGVARCEFYAEPGAAVRPFVQSGLKFGYLLVTGPDIGSAESTLAKALRTLRIDVNPAEARTVTAAPPAVVPRQRLPRPARQPVPSPNNRTVVDGAAHGR